MDNYTVNLLQTNKGNKKIEINGYIYIKNRENKSTINWECERRKDKCSGRVTTTICDNILKTVPTHHNHDPVASSSKVCLSNEFLKKNAKESDKVSCKIIAETIVRCEQPCRAYLPSKESQKKKVIRVRKKLNKNEPRNLSEINIPQILQEVDGEQFLLNVKTVENDVIIILGTLSNVRHLSNSKIWLMDGTFKVVPTLFRQLFTIHGMIGTNENNEIVPLIYCIMTRKTQKLYEEMLFSLFKFACDNNIQLNPEYILSDFEQASKKAFAEFIPGAKFKGCFFHFGQILWRRVQMEKLERRYGTDEKFSLAIRKLKALAFLPSADIPKYFEKISSVDSDFAKIMVFFAQNYVVGKTNAKGVLRAPAFPPSFWSVHENIVLNLPRTQNKLESWHRRLGCLVGKSHTGLYNLIGNLKIEQTVVTETINSIIGGNLKKKKLNTLDEKRK